MLRDIIDHCSARREEAERRGGWTMAAARRRWAYAEVMRAARELLEEMGGQAMPYLYCEEHGREHEARVIGNAAIYREEGESVLIVHGRLASGPWHCDRCNARLRRGLPAYLLSVYPRWLAESMIDYSFEDEQRYFARGGLHSIAVHGAAWPGDATALLPLRSNIADGAGPDAPASMG